MLRGSGNRLYAKHAGVYEGRLDIPCSGLEDESRGTVGKVDCFLL